jgi:glycosyltransferase involved in cell wall biosynthesis
VLVGPSTARTDGLGHVLRGADAVHCVSRAVERAATREGLDPARARVIASAADPNVFRPPVPIPVRDGQLVVVTVGALRWVKGYEYALAAIARLAAAGVPVRYEIVGAEPRARDEQGERDRILATVRDSGLGDRVELHGQLSEANVVRLLQQADVFLQASLSEGMPTAVLEAMACGLPVVATDVGGTSEVLTDGVEGVLVPPRDPRAAADAIEALHADPDRRRTMGEAARARVEARWTLERQLDGFESLYRELAAS